jgi:hypothetical protein
VSVNPADGLTVVAQRPNKVAFVNEDGTAKIVVKGRNGGQKVQAKAGSLADISGPGSWSGDVFETGVATSVSFMVGERSGTPGAPDITDIVTSDPTAEIGTVSYKDSDDGASASVKIKFVNGSQARVLAIRVRVETEHDEDEDDDSHARISIALSKLMGVPQPAGDAAGAKTWTGELCDGTPAQIAYVVNADGTITDVVATPSAAKVRVDGKQAKVQFAEGQSVRIRVRAKDGQIAVQVEENFRCRVTPVVTGASTTTTEVDDDDDDEQEEKEDGGKGRGRGRGGKGGGGGVPTTTGSTDTSEPTQSTVEVED